VGQGSGPRVGVVTDSTADLPLDLADELGLRVVPMSVSFGRETFISQVSITTEQFYDRLAGAEDLPTTAQPNPAWFEEAYADAVDDALDAVVSLHVSRELSGTVSSARVAARTAGIDVRVVDSRQVAGGLALMALAAQRAAEDGADVDGVVAAAERVRAGLRNIMVVDTMEYLRKGGRVSGAQAMVGSVLRVKPLLTVVDGRVEPFERTRTLRRGLERLAGVAAEQVGDRPAHVVVSHALAPERAEQLWALLRERLTIERALTTVFGPVLGTHVGPGAVAVAVVATGA
jgi:DegV family protein with EDD domain